MKGFPLDKMFNLYMRGKRSHNHESSSLLKFMQQFYHAVWLRWLNSKKCIHKLGSDHDLGLSVPMC